MIAQTIARPPADGFSAARITGAPVAALVRLISDETIMARFSEAVAPFAFRLHRKPGEIRIAGDRPAVLIVHRTLEKIAASMDQGAVAAAALKTCLDEVVEAVLRHELCFWLEGLPHPVAPLSLRQVAYINDLLDRHVPLVFGIGATGTGKTHLAIAAGLSLLARGDVRHVVITRPHEMLEDEVVTPTIRAEKKCDEQFNTYYDILDDLIGADETGSLIARRRLEIAPLGAIRARVFNRSFIVVDEAHHMNVRRMRMAATRAGTGSRMVIVGDPARSRLRSGEDSGLAHLLTMIEGSDIGRVHHFAAQQLTRNTTVARLEALYAREDPERFTEVTLPSEADGTPVRY